MRNGTGCQAVKASFMQVNGKGTSQMTGKPMYIIMNLLILFAGLQAHSYIPSSHPHPAARAPATKQHKNAKQRIAFIIKSLF